MPDPLEIAKIRVAERQRCKTDKLYLADVLGYDFQPATHKELFDCFISYDDSKPWGEQSDIKDRMVLWSRGHYKSTAIIVEAIQAVLNFPNLRVLLMQGSIPVTKTLLKQILSHFLGEAEGSRLKELFPEFCGSRKELEATAISFTVPCRTRKQLPQSTFTVASPKSVKTGQHYDLGLFDDLVNDQNFRNPNLLAKVKSDFTLAQALIDPGCYRFVTGTRYAFGDLYEEILRWQAKDKKWVVSVTTCWTKETEKLSDNEKVPRFPRFTKRTGELGGFTREELLQMQRDDPQNFACQYLNYPIAASKQGFTDDMFLAAMVNGVDVETQWLSQPVIVIDLASSDTERADDSVICVGKVDALGNGYLIDIRGDQWVPLNLAFNVIDMTLKHRPSKILLEKTPSGVIFADLLRLVARRKNIFLPIDFIKIDQRPDAKNMRVLGFAGVVKQGRFKFYMGLQGFGKLVTQAKQFPKGRDGHDDYVDGCALLWGELSKALLSMPVRPVPKNNILALIQDAEQAQASIVTAIENAHRMESVVDMTGFE